MDLPLRANIYYYVELSIDFDDRHVSSIITLVSN
jgi:hypothetical protein